MRHLLKALAFTPRELLQFDFFLGVLGGAAGWHLAQSNPVALGSVVSVVQQIVGAILGSVIAGVAIQAAFFDDQFLRKMKDSGTDPISCMAPFLFTAALGVVSMLLLIVLTAVTTPAPGDGPASSCGVWILATACGFTSVWTIASLVPALDTMVQFVRLKMEATDVPDSRKE
jgi:hypothetical protein